MRAGRPRSRGDAFRTQTGVRHNTSDFDTSQRRADSSSVGTDSTPSEQVDLMVCTAMSLADAQTLAEKDPPGARASRPHKTWHDRRDPRNGGFDALCKRVAVVGRLFAGIRCGRDARAPGGMSFRTQTGARRNTSDFDTSQPRANSSSAGTDSTSSE